MVCAQLLADAWRAWVNITATAVGAERTGADYAPVSWCGAPTGEGGSSISGLLSPRQSSSQGDPSENPEVDIGRKADLLAGHGLLAQALKHSGCVGVVGVRAIWRSRLLLAPVVRLAASVVAEPFIAAVFSSVGTRSRQRNDAAAELAPGDVAGGSHEPPHLQVHRPYEAVEVPDRVYCG